MAEEIVTIGFRGTEEYRKMLQQEALNRGFKVQRMLEEAIAHYLGQGTPQQDVQVQPDKGSTPFGDLSPEEARWLKAFLGYLRDDSQPFKENILAILAGALGATAEELSPKKKRKMG